MTVDLFIRTYEKDLPWLAFALRSIHLHVTGYRRIIVTIPKGDVALLRPLTQEQVHGVPDLEDGYLGQQLTKLEAWRYTDADAIVYWDSDVVAKGPLDIRSLFVEDRPILYKTAYASIEGVPWQPITEKAMGFPVLWEYMRRMPMVHLRSAVMATCAHLEATHGVLLREYFTGLPHRAFSEFNAIGAIAERYFADRYHIVDTEAGPLPECMVDQMWSWGGITEEVMGKMKSYGL